MRKEEKVMERCAACNKELVENEIVVECMSEECSSVYCAKDAWHVNADTRDCSICKE